MHNNYAHSLFSQQPQADFTPEIRPLPDAGRDFSTPKAQQRDTPPLQMVSSPVPYYNGTHDTPHIRKCTHTTEEQRDAQTQFPLASLATVITDSQVCYQQQLSYLHALLSVQVVRSVSFSSPFDMLAVGANSHLLRVYSVSTVLEDNAIRFGIIIRIFLSVIYSPSNSCRSLPLLYQQPGYHRGSIYCLAWWKDSLLASGSNDQTIRLLSHSPEGQFTSQGLLTGFKNTIREVVFMPSGLLLSCGAGGNGLRLSDCQQGSAVQTFHGHSSQVLAVTSLDEHRFASGGEDGTVKLWDVRCSSNPTSSLSLPQAVTSLSSHSNHLACSTTAGACHLIEMSSGLSLQNSFSPSTSECRSIRYSSSGSWLLTGSYSGEVGLAHSFSFLWQPICSHNDKVIQCRWHPSGSLIATTGADKTARVWKLH